MQIKHLISFFLLFSLLCAVPCSANHPAQIVLSEQQMKSAIERFVAEKVEGRGWDTSIRQLSLPKGIKVSKGTCNIEIVAPDRWEGWGSVTVAMIVRVNGVIEKNLSIRLHVDALADMVVAKRQLLGGTIISPDDIQLQKENLAKAGGYPVHNLEDATGKKLRTAVRAGAPIKSNQLAAVPLIVSGQMVTIVAENSGIRITVSGKARSAGGIGDLIRVQNLTSNKEIPARILDASTVVIGF